MNTNAFNSIFFFVSFCFDFSHFRNSKPSSLFSTQLYTLGAIIVWCLQFSGVRLCELNWMRSNFLACLHSRFCCCCFLISAPIRCFCLFSFRILHSDFGVHLLFCWRTSCGTRERDRSIWCRASVNEKLFFLFAVVYLAEVRLNNKCSRKMQELFI